MSAFFHFQHTLNRLFMFILILNKFFLKYEEGVKLTTPHSPAPEKTTLKKPNLIRIKKAAIIIAILGQKTLH